MLRALDVKRSRKCKTLLIIRPPISVGDHASLLRCTITRCALLVEHTILRKASFVRWYGNSHTIHNVGYRTLHEVFCMTMMPGPREAGEAIATVILVSMLTNYKLSFAAGDSALGRQRRL
jgi:hypothetical protein